MTRSERDELDRRIGGLEDRIDGGSQSGSYGTNGTYDRGYYDQGRSGDRTAGSYDRYGTGSGAYSGYDGSSGYGAYDGSSGYDWSGSDGSGHDGYDGSSSYDGSSGYDGSGSYSGYDGSTGYNGYDGSGSTSQYDYGTHGYNGWSGSTSGDFNDDQDWNGQDCVPGTDAGDIGCVPYDDETGNYDDPSSGT